MFRFILVLLLLVSACSTQIVRSPSSEGGRRYGREAAPLSTDYSYFQSTKASPQFWKLMPYYRHQLTNCSCSVAAANIVLNAMHPSYTVNPNETLFTEAKTLELSESEKWKKATENDSTGMTLRDFNSEIGNLLKKLNLNRKYNSQFFEMRTVQDAATFQEHLKKFNRGEGWLIVMFSQGAVMGGSAIYPHYSPIGAFDEDKNRVLILDVDGTWYEPYWLPVSNIITNMTAYDEEMKCQRGYIWISLR